MIYLEVTREVIKRDRTLKTMVYSLTTTSETNSKTTMRMTLKMRVKRARRKISKRKMMMIYLRSQDPRITKRVMSQRLIKLQSNKKRSSLRRVR